MGYKWNESLSRSYISKMIESQVNPLKEYIEELKGLVDSQQLLIRQLMSRFDAHIVGHDSQETKKTPSVFYRQHIARVDKGFEVEFKENQWVVSFSLPSKTQSFICCESDLDKAVSGCFLKVLDWIFESETES